MRRTSLLALLLVGCAQTHTRDLDARLADAAFPVVDTLPIPRLDAPIDAARPIDAFFPAERTFTLRTGECFTFATQTIESFTSPMRCGDMSLEGESFPYLVGIDGTLCGLEGTFHTLDSIPTPATFPCGRVINLDGEENRAFYVRVDDAHHYRVHVFSSTPMLTFSFDEITER